MTFESSTNPHLELPARLTSGNRSRRLSNYWFGFLITLPALAVLLLIFLYPVAYSAWQSFRNYELGRAGSEWVGIQNYIDVLQSRQFKRAFENTVRYTVIAVPIELVLGLAIAIALHHIEVGKNVIRVLIVLPMMLAPVAMGLMWKFMYNDQLGVINHALKATGLVEAPPLWLADPSIALYSIIAVDIWATTPLVVLLMLAGLTGIPEDIYEASSIDGGGAVSNFIDLTLPMLRPVILVTLLLRGMDAFRVFDIVYVLTGGGPAFRTDVLSFLAYRTAFTDREIGTASAIAWLMTIVLLVAAVALIFLLRKPEEKQ